jgi:hypothetical protein
MLTIADNREHRARRDIGASFANPVGADYRRSARLPKEPQSISFEILAGQASDQFL